MNTSRVEGADEKAALVSLYEEIDASVRAANPRCNVSGRCCRFKEYDHTLFISALEAAVLLKVAPEQGRPLTADACPYQVGGLCTARERRPLGCRIYFCDPAYADHMVDLSEYYIRRLKDLHEYFDRGWDYRPLHRFFPLLGDEPKRASPVLPIIDSP